MMALGGLLAVSDRRYRLAVRKRQQVVSHGKIATAAPNAVANMLPETKG
jgi:hypothetical protein